MNKKIAAVLLLATIASPLYAAEKLTVVSFGGNNRQAQEKAFYKPFTAQTGVRHRPRPPSKTRWRVVVERLMRTSSQ